MKGPETLEAGRKPRGLLLNQRLQLAAGGKPRGLQLHQRLQIFREKHDRFQVKVLTQ